jgi:hypothetical protein
MSKAINWPAQCLDAVLKSEAGDNAIALRLNPIYAQHHYWQKRDVVEIRVANNAIRQAVITQGVEQYELQALDAELLKQLPLPETTPEAVAEFLTQTYNQPVTPESVVCMVQYQYR